MSDFIVLIPTFIKPPFRALLMFWRYWFLFYYPEEVIMGFVLYTVI